MADGFDKILGAVNQEKIETTVNPGNNWDAIMKSIELSDSGRLEDQVPEVEPTAPVVEESDNVERSEVPRFEIPEGAARGIRNNNPGNIDRTKTKWRGMAEDQSGDERFIVFDSPEFGVRAIGKVLNTYQSKYNLKTVRGMIDRWAPPVENDTEAYINAVAGRIGVDPDEPVDIRDRAVLKELVTSIIKHENGDMPYPEHIIEAGLSMTGIPFQEKPQHPEAEE